MKRDLKNQCKISVKMGGTISIREFIKTILIVLISIAILFSPDSSSLAVKLTEVLIKDLVGVVVPPAVSQPVMPDSKSDVDYPGQKPGLAAGAASGKAQDLCPRY